MLIYDYLNLVDKLKLIQLCKKDSQDITNYKNSLISNREISLVIKEYGIAVDKKNSKIFLSRNFNTNLPTNIMNFSKKISLYVNYENEIALEAFDYFLQRIKNEDSECIKERSKISIYCPYMF
jgi:hypothetical protein